MAAGKHNFEIEQGATFTRTFTITDNAVPPVAINLTNITEIRMDVKDHITDAVPAYQWSSLGGTPEIVITDAANGIFTITVSAAVTGAMTFNQGVYDMEFEWNTTVVERILQGRVIVLPQVAP